MMAFNRLIQVLSLQAGSLVNLNELSRDLGIARETLERYLFLLENTFIIKMVPPFYSNKRKEIIKMPKIFFDDTGLRYVDPLPEFQKNDPKSLVVSENDFHPSRKANKILADKLTEKIRSLSTTLQNQEQ